MKDKIYTTYLNLLKEYITFKSVSTLENEVEIKKAADWLVSIFVSNGFKSKVISGYDNPVVLSTLEVDHSYPTILIYGHYDVQPASEEEWGWNPFELVEKQNRLFARGVVDNKGQMMVHLATVIELIKSNELQFNIKFLIEGNEETGSPNIPKLLEKYQQELESDLILISDSSMVKNRPTIEASLRGVLNTTLVIKTSDRELHSGLYGGPVPNAIQEASNLLSKFYTTNNRIAISGFYDKVEANNKLKSYALANNLTNEQYLALTGSNQILLEEGENFYSQIGLRPTIQVTGIQAGYTGKGYRNSIPSEAIIKINIRLVPDQDPSEVLELLKEFVKENLPRYVSFDFLKPEKTEGVVKAIVIDTDNQFTQLAVQLLKNVFGKEVVYDFNGATLPIVVSFQEILKTDLLMVALVNEDCNMHAVGENYDLQTLKKAITFSYKFLSSRI